MADGVVLVAAGERRPDPAPGGPSVVRRGAGGRGPARWLGPLGAAQAGGDSRGGRPLGEAVPNQDRRGGRRGLKRRQADAEAGGDWSGGDRRGSDCSARQRQVEPWRLKLLSAVAATRDVTRQLWNNLGKFLQLHHFCSRQIMLFD